MSPAAIRGGSKRRRLGAGHTSSHAGAGRMANAWASSWTRCGHCGQEQDSEYDLPAEWPLGCDKCGVRAVRPARRPLFSSQDKAQLRKLRIDPDR